KTSAIGLACPVSGSDETATLGRDQQIARESRPEGLGIFANQPLPLPFGWSSRSSRNSSGPLVSRRRRWARSSGAAVASSILSIASLASSRARNLRPGLPTGGGADPLTVRPSSATWPMAGLLTTGLGALDEVSSSASFSKVTFSVRLLFPTSAVQVNSA